MSQLLVNEIMPYTGSSIIINGVIISGGTLSASTYNNLPLDITVTGGTYSDGTAMFTNNTGGTFSVSGFYTGATEVLVTGGTYSDGTATFTNNTGGTFSVSGFTTPFTGGTVIGETIFNSGLSATTVSATTYFGDGSNLTGIENYTEVAYSGLVSMINSSSLKAGSFYLISDYRTCYDQPDFDYNNNSITSITTYHSASIEPIMVLATSENTLSVDAYQPIYPKDKIKYDHTFNTTEVTGGIAYGRITERIDEFGNRTDYDHRTILFKRYRSYFQDGTIAGRIINMNNGVVTGLNTNFTGDLTVGDVVMIYHNNPLLYEVIDISSVSGMTVNGFNYENFSDAVGYRCERMNSQQGLLDGCLYYFNDVANGEGISDGGNDMYNSGNYLNTNLANNIPYTHTRMTDPPINIFDPASFGDFVYDGTVQSGDTYFGSGSTYFTNMYPGLFVTTAYGVSIDRFNISGDLGADGGGFYDTYFDTLSGYSIYGKFVYGAQDPSVNHLMIVNTIDNNIVHDFATNTNDDYDSISGITGTTQVHYLLFALAGGIKPTNTQIQNVVSSYLSLVDSIDINTTLSTLNANFTGVTSNLPANQLSYKSLNFKQNNITGDTVNYQEFTTFGNNCFNNYIGNYANLYDIEGNPFILANNVFYGNTDYLNNTFGDACFNNTFDDDCTENIVGNYFYNNVTDDDFDQNVIGNYFYNNYITANFQRNRITYNFYDNTITNGSFYRNDIGNDFNGNIVINGDFQNNRIGNQFQNNKLEQQFYKNNIGNGYNNNRIFSENVGNKIGNGFNNNQQYCNFEDNNIGDYFNNNLLGDSNNIGSYNFYRNRIGFDFYGNTISGQFRYNEIGSNFYNNVIGDGFGFGFNASQGNTIGNYFYDNTIGEYFYNNTIADGFISNQVYDYFQMNNVKIPFLNGVDFTLYYGNITGFTFAMLGTTATDSIYNGLTGATNGSGINASFDVEVSGGTVIGVTGVTVGKYYGVGNIITILGSQIGGTDVSDDLVISVTGITPTPSVYEAYNCELFKNSGNIDRLSYYDSSDALNIKNINI